MQDRSLSNIGPNLSPQRRYELASILTSGTLNELGTPLHRNFINLCVLCTKKSTGVVDGLDAI